MNNGLPKKYEKGFFEKIKNFFLDIFSMKKVEINKVEENNLEKNNEIKEREQINYFEEMKEVSKKEHIKQDIVSIIDKNPELIKTLSLLQLKELNKIYKKIIEEIEKNIKKLEKVIA